jgi:tetratricopeptide (TPR) repeat protein
MTRLVTGGRARIQGLAERVPPAVIRALPVAALLVVTWRLSWSEHGSIAAGDWLLYAVLVALVLATVLLSGAAVLPARAALVSVGLLVAFSAWEALSLTWSPVPSLARDEALLTLLYALVLATPLVTLRSDTERMVALGALVAGLTLLGLAVALKLRFGAHPLDLYDGGRLNFPIGYANAQPGILLVGFWPAVVLASKRGAPAAARSLSLGAAVALLAVSLAAQSKGSALGLAISAIVFFAVFPGRLRSLVPALLAVGLVGAVFYPLTEPFRASGDAAAGEAIRTVGTTVLWLTAGAIALGLAYTLLDRRLELSERARLLAGRVALGVLVVAVVGGLAGFFVKVHHPIGFAGDKWRSFKHLPGRDQTSTHLLTLGSNRYDFWRVALIEFERHPLNGTGARGFATAYLQERRSPETPERAHSLPLEVLSEEGLVGFSLLAGALAIPLGLAARRAKHAYAAAALGGAVYWLAHASVDWIWTFPAVGIPFFLVLGIGASGDERNGLRGPLRRIGGLVTILLALFAFAPPWLSARLVSHATSNPASAGTDLRWAHRFDPLSPDPLFAEADLAASPAKAIPPLEEVVRMEPRAVEAQYRLGTAYLSAGRRPDARRHLLEALRLDPGDPLILEALRGLR